MNKGYDVQQLLARTSRRQMNEYWNRIDDDDLDRIEMRRLIIEHGETAAGAARILNESGRSSRGFDALHYQARKVLAEIFEHLDIPAEDLMKNLRRDGEIHIHPSRLPELRRMCKAGRVDIEVDLRLRRI